MAAGTTPTQMPTFHTCSEPLLTTANSTSVQCNADTGMFGQEDYLGKTEFCYAMCGPITKPLADTDTYPPPAIRNARSEVCNIEFKNNGCRVFAIEQRGNLRTVPGAALLQASVIGSIVDVNGGCTTLLPPRGVLLLSF